jgi:hypothetical protein
MKKVGVISAFYKIFGQSFERLKQLMFWENDKDIGKTTVDSWGFLWLIQMNFYKIFHISGFG